MIMKEFDPSIICQPNDPRVAGLIGKEVERCDTYLFEKDYTFKAVLVGSDGEKIWPFRFEDRCYSTFIRPIPEKKYRPFTGKELAQLFLECVVDMNGTELQVISIDREKLVLSNERGYDIRVRTPKELLDRGFTWNGKPLGIEV